MKAVLVVVILVAAAAVVFWVGWVQLLIPPGAYAVIHTKTGGFEPAVIPSGVFAWRWERLLPTNLTVYAFVRRPVTVEGIVVKGVLPSGDVYSAAMDGHPDFSYEVTLTLTVNVRPESLPRLVAEEGLRPERWEPWLRERAGAAADALVRAIISDPLAALDPERRQKLTDEAKLPEDLILESLILQNLRVPDRDLYETARRRYLALAEAQAQTEVTALHDDGASLAALREYGELLERYPVLLQYLYLQSVRGEENRSLVLGLLDMLRASDVQPREAPAR